MSVKLSSYIEIGDHVERHFYESVIEKAILGNFRVKNPDARAKWLISRAQGGCMLSIATVGRWTGGSF